MEGVVDIFVEGRGTQILTEGVLSDGMTSGTRTRNDSLALVFLA